MQNSHRPVGRCFSVSTPKQASRSMSRPMSTKDAQKSLGQCDGIRLSEGLATRGRTPRQGSRMLQVCTVGKDSSHITETRAQASAAVPLLCAAVEPPLRCAAHNGYGDDSSVACSNLRLS